LATCPLHFAKAGSYTTLPQQVKSNSDVVQSQPEKSSSADVQRGGLIPRGNVP